MLPIGIRKLSQKEKESSFLYDPLFEFEKYFGEWSILQKLLPYRRSKRNSSVHNPMAPPKPFAIITCPLSTSIYTRAFSFARPRPVLPSPSFAAWPFQLVTRRHVRLHFRYVALASTGTNKLEFPESILYQEPNKLPFELTHKFELQRAP